MITTIITPEGDEKQLRTKWAICTCCEGEGKSSAYLGAFSHDDMEEQGPDFIDDYVAGHYDRACEPCSGSGKIKVVDFDRVPAEDLKLWEEQMQELRDERAAHLVELKAGA